MPYRFPVPTPPAAGSLLDQARTAFDGLSCGPQPVTVDGRAFAGLPARPVRLDELRDRLHDRRCLAATRDPVWAFLVHRARVDAGVWTIACLGCALPSLIETSRRLRHGHLAHPARPADRRRSSVRPHTPVAGVPAVGVGPAGPVNQPDLRPARRGRDAVSPGSAAGDVLLGDLAVSEMEAAVLAGFLAELAVVDLTRGRVLGRLRSAAHEAGVAACREMTRAPTPRVQLLRSCPAPTPARHPDLVLARAVAAGALSRTEAALIGSTRLEPVSLAEVAVVRGQSYRDVRAARIRAERKLSVFLREQDSGSIDTLLNPTATSSTGDTPRPAAPAATTSPSRTRRRRIRRRPATPRTAPPPTTPTPGTPTTPTHTTKPAPPTEPPSASPPGPVASALSARQHIAGAPHRSRHSPDRAPAAGASSSEPS
jgi:hypothetical protein